MIKIGAIIVILLLLIAFGIVGYTFYTDNKQFGYDSDSDSDSDTD